MLALPLHEFHARHGATFTRLNDAELVAHYGDPRSEHAALRQTGAVLDLAAACACWAATASDSSTAR